MRVCRLQRLALRVRPRKIQSVIQQNPNLFECALANLPSALMQN